MLDARYLMLDARETKGVFLGRKCTKWGKNKQKKVFCHLNEVLGIGMLIPPVHVKTSHFKPEYYVVHQHLF